MIVQNNVYVVEQPGIIRVFNNDSSVTSSKVFLDIRDRVLSGGEQGLLGLAFHPDFENNGIFYVDYTASNPRRTVISRFYIKSNTPNEADPSSEERIMEINQPYSNHNGGRILFGPDGYLYIGMGDGGSGGDPQGNGQNRQTLLGTILRIDVDHPASGKQYGIPPDNPFAGNTNGFREEIYAYGLRNPWRFSFDPVTKDLWAGDVGQNKYEEIDIIKPGKNYGWNIVEGFHCYSPSSGCDTTGLVPPVWEYSHSEGHSITGGVVYRGKKLSTLNGQYIYADFVKNKVWALDYISENNIKNKLILNVDNVSSFGTDPDGEIYLCSFDGNIYKIIKE